MWGTERNDVKQWDNLSADRLSRAYFLFHYQLLAFLDHGRKRKLGRMLVSIMFPESFLVSFAYSPFLPHRWQPSFWTYTTTKLINFVYVANLEPPGILFVPGFYGRHYTSINETNDTLLRKGNLYKNILLRIGRIKLALSVENKIRKNIVNLYSIRENRTKCRFWLAKGNLKCYFRSVQIRINRPSAS